MRFFIRICMCPYPHSPDSHILDKSCPKKFFCKGVRRCFEISLLSFIHKIFEQNFYLYITVYLVRIWTYKNADEKAHTLSRRSKNVKKRTKTYEKRILCKFTFIAILLHQFLKSWVAQHHSTLNALDALH